MVHPKVVQPQEWLDRSIRVKGVNGEAQQAPLAKHVGEYNYSIPLVVSVLENAQDDVLIGRDIGLVFNELMMQHITESR